MTKIRLLVVEDDPDIIDLLQAILDPPYEILRANNGLEGFQLAHSGDPDLIISDIMMPMMNGHDFVERLRREPGFGEIPVIFLSALASRDDIKMGYELGAALYLTKPIDPTRLKRNIELFMTDHSLQARPKRLPLEQAQAEVSFTRAKEAVERAARPAPPRTPPARPAAPAPSPSPEPVAGPENIVKAEPRRKGPARDKDKPRILVVEDDADAMEMIFEGLRGRYEVVPAFDGMEAMHRTAQFNPDLLIVDGMLPKMTGYQLIGMLRKNKTFKDVPIIFISGKASPRDRAHVEKLGVQKFLPKPFDIEQLNEAVRAIVDDPNFEVREKTGSHQRARLESLADFERIRTDRTPKKLKTKTVRPSRS